MALPQLIGGGAGGQVEGDTDALVGADLFRNRYVNAGVNLT